MVDRTSSDVTLTIHGLDRDERDVEASVFAAKVREFISALSAADRHVNKSKRHRYLVIDLQHGSAELTLAERPINADAPSSPSVPTFLEAMDAAYRNNATAFHRLNGLGRSIAKLCKDAGDKYAFAEITSAYLPSPILIDPQVSRQVQRLLAETATEVTPPTMFRGQAEDSFDGDIKEIDLRGKIPKGKLVLSGGRKEIDCVFPSMTINELRALIDRRVWVDGLAIYDGISGLPGRIEVQSVRAIGMGEGLRRWQGKLQPPESEPEWGDWLDG